MASDHPSATSAHAPAADRALGLELELIELVRRQDEAGPRHPETARLQVQVDAVVDELVELSAVIAPLGR